MGARLYTSPLPLQLRIIQARIVAQGGLIVGAVALAAVSHFTSDEQAKKPATSSMKTLRNYDVKTPVVPVVVTVPAVEVK